MRCSPVSGPASQPSSELPCDEITFTAIVAMEAHEQRHEIHGDRDPQGRESGREAHEEMGFHDGWGKALDQLVAHARTM